MSFYPISGIMLHVFFSLSYSIFTLIFEESTIFYFHFTDEEIETKCHDLCVIFWNLIKSYSAMNDWTVVLPVSCIRYNHRWRRTQRVKESKMSFKHPPLHMAFYKPHFILRTTLWDSYWLYFAGEITASRWLSHLPKWLQKELELEVGFKLWSGWLIVHFLPISYTVSFAIVFCPKIFHSFHSEWLHDILYPRQKCFFK